MDYTNKKAVTDVEVSGKKVLVRCDFNVPLDEHMAITDVRRIKESLRTIRYLMEKDAKIILCSHLGRPEGVWNERLSLKPVAAQLTELLGKSVRLCKDVVGEDAKNTVAALKNAQVCLLENLRFHKEEEENNSEFAKKIASLADVFVNDAFGTCHRSHASTVGITKYLPSVCGFLVQKEVSVMSDILESPKRPFVSILGGAKVSDKIGVINSLLDKVDKLIIGGGMAYTFTNAMGYSVGTSLCESDKLDLARNIMAKAKEKGVKLCLPLDNKVGKAYDPNTESKVVDADKIPDGWMGLDIGEKTQKFFAQTIEGAGTVVWNGPMGVYEWDRFAEGTVAIAKAVAESGAVSIIGGGDSAAAIEKLGFADRMTHISTGGGASLCFLEGRDLPGLAVLNEKQGI
jgi:phosphoglycerate kinase